MKVVLKDVRLSYHDLWEPKTVGVEANAKPAYDATFLFPPGHPAQALMEQAIEAVASAKWGAKGDSVLKTLRAGNKVCLHDGDTKDCDGYAGMLYVSARGYAAPVVVDRRKQPLSAQSGIPYMGCYVNAVVDVWAQDNTFGRRINAGLAVVQFVRDGEPFGPSNAVAVKELPDLGDDDNDLI